MTGDPPKLLTPGPTSVPPAVLEALARPVLHHRGGDFKALFVETLERLRAVFRTEGDVLLLTASGTGAFESAIVNVHSAGERVLVVSCGEFGERWQKLCAAHGLDVVPLRHEWGTVPQPHSVASAIAEHGPSSVVLVHSETSTGVVIDLEPMLTVCRDAGVLTIVDAISSLGAVPLETQAWGADVVVTGSQKALMTPPGLSFVAISGAAWVRAEHARLPRFYFDWGLARAAQEKGSTAFTPATSTVAALHAALGVLLGDGLERAFERHRAHGRACRAGVGAMGLALYSPDDDSSAVLTGALTPEGVPAPRLRAALREKHGLEIAGGHGEIADRLFRIGHIGYVSEDDIVRCVAAIGSEINALGGAVDQAAAGAAARAAYGDPVPAA
ncbi:MAG: pyridoxal-phosphate-dependent aminotransferase family protein [Gaiella sp.]